MYPTFCRFPADAAGDDPTFAAVSAAFGLGRQRPGLALEEQGGMVRVLVIPGGRTQLFPTALLKPGLPEDAALGLMDAVEEAIEDAREDQDGDRDLVTRLEATLALMERCLVDDETPG